MRIDHRVEATAEVRPNEVCIALFQRHADLDLARIVRNMGYFDPSTSVRRVGIESPFEGFGIPRIFGHILATTEYRYRLYNQAKFSPVSIVIAI